MADEDNKPEVSAEAVASFFETDEGKTFLSGITKPLEEKNKELLGEVKSLKSKGPGLSDDEVKDLKTKAQRLAALEQEKAEADGDFKKLLETARTQHAEEMTSVTTERDALKSQLKSAVVDGGLTRELARVGVAEVVMDMVIPGLSSKVVIHEGKAVVGDQDLKTFVDEWAKTEAAQFFITSGNGGGGAGGGKGGRKADGAEEEKFFDPKNADWNLTEQMRVRKADPELYKALKEKHGDTTPNAGINTVGIHRAS